MPHLPSNDYFKDHYAADFAVFGGNMMCGISLSKSLALPKRSRFKGIAEFVVCQFELNLLNQAIYTHQAKAHPDWRAFSAPFADTHLCFHGHGLGNHLPSSILRFAQEPWVRPDAAPVTLTWEMLADYTNFFLGEYLDQFRATESGKDFSRDALIEAICNDRDCLACLKTAQGWESRRVIELFQA
jgi:hypothetical protein